MTKLVSKIAFDLPFMKSAVLVSQLLQLYL